MHAILFLYEIVINFYFVTVKTSVRRVDSFILKINLTALCGYPQGAEVTSGIPTER